LPAKKYFALQYLEKHLKQKKNKPKNKCDYFNSFVSISAYTPDTQDTGKLSSVLPRWPDSQVKIFLSKNVHSVSGFAGKVKTLSPCLDQCDFRNSNLWVFQSTPNAPSWV